MILKDSHNVESESPQICIGVKFQIEINPFLVRVDQL